MWPEPWTTPVGYYDGTPYGTYTTQNAQSYYGCYDMTGNVFEWCHDWYNDIYYSVSPYSNPTGPTTGDQRVLRGGDWELNPDSCRTSFRVDWTPSGRAHPDGFRCALGLP